MERNLLSRFRRIATKVDHFIIVTLFNKLITNVIYNSQTTNQSLMVFFSKFRKTEVSLKHATYSVTKA